MNEQRRGSGKVARSAEAEVVSASAGSERVLLRELATQVGFDTWAPPEVANRLEAGMRVTVYLDAEDRVVGWYLPDQGLGVRED